MNCYALVDAKKKVIKIDVEDGILCIFDKKEDAERYLSKCQDRTGIEIWERDLKMMPV